MKDSVGTAYLGISQSNRKDFINEIEIIRQCLLIHQIKLEVFVDKYQFNPDQEKQMMTVAFQEIDKCELMIAELTKKAIGVGVEVGYAKAKNKPIIYLRKTASPHSTTVGGSSDFFIKYSSPKQLKHELANILKDHF